MDDIIGKKFGKLTAIRFEFKDKYYYKHYLFKCECGKEKIINFKNVKSGKTKSCGCNYKIMGEKLKKRNKYVIKKDYVIGYTSNTNKEFYIDLDDYEKIKNMCWRETKNHYIAYFPKGKVIFLHRYIMNAPTNKIVDHINHNRADNRKGNLRIATYKQNALNRTKTPKGIVEHKVGNHKYYTIYLNGYRGNYKTYDEAKRVRDLIIKNEYVIN